MPGGLRWNFSTMAQRKGVGNCAVKYLSAWSVVPLIERHHTGQVKEGCRRAMDRVVGMAYYEAARSRISAQVGRGGAREPA